MPGPDLEPEPETKKSRQYRWAQKMQKRGRCRTCGKPRNISKQYCDLHHEWQKNYQRERYYNTRPAPEWNPRALKGGA